MSVRSVMSDIKYFFSEIWWAVSPPWKCAECRDTGWVSKDIRVGPRTWHVADHCDCLRRKNGRKDAQ